MKKAIVVGSGAGGATVAKELQGQYHVTVLETGKPFEPFRLPLERFELMRQAGLLYDERHIHYVMPAYRVERSKGNMTLVSGSGLGGTTTLCTGNALRMDHALKTLGIDLDGEFEEISREIPITTAHQQNWRRTTRQLFSIFQGLGLEPQPMPKMGRYEHCLHCGRCQLGCPQGIKWDSRHFLQRAVEHGAEVKTGCTVESVVIAGGRTTGVRVKNGWAQNVLPADLVILAAGGLGTARILANSGVACERHLFTDPVLCMAARLPDCRQHREVSMPFVSTQGKIILSPYFDHLSFFFNRDWRAPADDIVSIMIKLADEANGSVSRGEVKKALTDQDREQLGRGVELCREILSRFGARQDAMFLGTLIAGHPGGTLPLTAREATSLHDERLPENLYVADASLLPQSLGNPPILTIIALAKRISKILCKIG